MLYIVLVYTPETAECLEKENLFYGNQRGSNAGVFLLRKTSSKVPLELQKIRGCHSPCAPELVTPPQPAPLRGAAESPTNSGSRSTRRPLAPTLPGYLKQCQNALSELGKHMVWGWGPAGRLFVRISCKHRRTTHTQHCNPGIYCLCSFSHGQNLQCSKKPQKWANTDLWSASEEHEGTMRSV